MSERLAGERVSERASERVLLFTYAGLTLTLPASVGREAFAPPYLTPLPGGGNALLGLTEVRGRAVPLLNLSSLVGQYPMDQKPSTPNRPTRSELPTLALLIEVQGEFLALPVEEVIGLISLDALPDPPGLLSEPFQAGDHTARHLNPAALGAAVRTRLKTA
jgi:chemotaxis signal transduction protein